MLSFQEIMQRYFDKDLINKLKETKQNPKYHTEGSIYNHTWLVYNHIKEASHLTDENKVNLLLCAIFHDLGKIDCTKEKVLKDGTKAIIAYGHENYAKDYLDKYLHLFRDNFDYDKQLIYYVCKNHMRIHNFEKMSQHKRLKLQNHDYFLPLVEFSKFDKLGKIKPPDLIFTIGIPGSGKSTWAKGQENYNIVCPDDIRKEIAGNISDMSQDNLVWKIVKERTIELLKQDKNVILDSTMCKSKYRLKFLDGLPICFTYAKVFDAQPQIAKQRIKEDLLNKKDRSKVPDSVIDNMYQNFKEDINLLTHEGFELLS